MRVSKNRILGTPILIKIYPDLTLSSLPTFINNKEREVLHVRRVRFIVKLN